MAPQVEDHVSSGFSDIGRGNLSILINHQLSIVANTDCIFVHDCGSIVENGSHAEPIQRHSLYTAMFELQAQGYCS
jgi:ABC-type multidrug transport system fused ATPase/permease subunit